VQCPAFARKSNTSCRCTTIAQQEGVTKWIF
jgi:hypothetical protein